MKIYLHTDNISYGSPRFYKKYLDKLGVLDEEKTNKEEGYDCVLNICSINQNGIKKGKKCTVYVEGDEFLAKGKSVHLYNQSDILYICQQNYLSYYPSKTKLLKSGIDPEWHYPRDVKKEYDYIFVGRTTGNPVYDDRRSVLEELGKSKYKIFVTNGTQETYPDLMSSGRIILNILPKIGDDVCINTRVFEGMAIGCLMTDYNKALDDFGFIKNVHYLPLERFGDISDEEIIKVHKAGSEFILQQYTYPKAIQQIIKDIEDFTGEKVC